MKDYPYLKIGSKGDYVNLLKPVICATTIAATLSSCATVDGNRGSETGKAVATSTKTSWWVNLGKVIPLVRFSVGWHGVEVGVSIGNPNITDLSQIGEKITEKTGVKINTQ